MKSKEYEKELIGFEWQPVYHLKGGLSTAAFRRCPITGLDACHHGGPRSLIAKETFDVIMNDSEVQELIRKKVLEAKEK